MFSNNIKRVLAATCLAATGLSGCGGSDSSTPNVTLTVTTVPTTAPTPTNTPTTTPTPTPTATPTAPAVTATPSPPEYTSPSTRVEAEYSSISINGVIVVDASASSAKAVSLVAGDGVSWMPSADAQSISIGYKTSGAAVLRVSVNGDMVGTLNLERTAEYQDVGINIPLDSDANVFVEVESSGSAVMIDYIEFNPGDLGVTHFQEVKTTSFNIGTENVDHMFVVPSGDIFMTGQAMLRKLLTNGQVETIDVGAQFLVGIDMDSAGNLLLADFEGQKVIELDTEGNTTVLAEGFGRPSGLVVNNQDEVFVSLWDDRRVVQIMDDGTTVLVAEGDEIIQPIGLAVDEQDRLFVATCTNTAGNIYRIGDDASLNLLANVVDDCINQLTYTDDYIYTMAGDAVHRINVETGDTEEFIGSDSENAVDGHVSVADFDRAGFLTASNDGTELFTANSNGDVIRIGKPDSIFQFVSTIHDLSRHVDGINLTEEGEVVLSGNNVTAVALDGSTEEIQLGQPGINGPLGLDYDASGDLIIASWDERSIFKVSDGQTQRLASSLDGPNDILVASDGFIYVPMCGLVNLNGETVGKFDADGNLVDTIQVVPQGQGGCVAGVVEGDDGIIYVSVWNSGAIYKIENDTASLLAEVKIMRSGQDVPSNINHIAYFNGHVIAPSHNFGQIHRVNANTGDVTLLVGTGAVGNADGHVSGASFESIMNVRMSANKDALYVVNGTRNFQNPGPNNGVVKVISTYILPQ